MPLNRRKFLKKSAVTGAGVALTGAVAAPSAQAATAASAAAGGNFLDPGWGSRSFGGDASTTPAMDFSPASLA
ncbi:twin-arginine translocation signal domain-containing protein [Streptomyces sp. NBC_01136]|uniref:twin-arginine translocation signal domain-containing protein n=1 Tax=unclassified Streptomyces TaxID=2593676 RepID=UPI0032527393|nr:twin-arginine translocation signal domain-containing protein [Streptomyces sp. NBC_01136]